MTHVHFLCENYPVKTLKQVSQCGRRKYGHSHPGFSSGYQLVWIKCSYELRHLLVSSFSYRKIRLLKGKFPWKRIQLNSRLPLSQRNQKRPSLRGINPQVKLMVWSIWSWQSMKFHLVITHHKVAVHQLFHYIQTLCPNAFNVGGCKHKYWWYLLAAQSIISSSNEGDVSIVVLW